MHILIRCRSIPKVLYFGKSRSWTLLQRSITNLATSISARVSKYNNRIAVIDTLGQHSYKDIYYHSYQVAVKVTSYLPPAKSGDQQRVAFLTSRNVSYIIAQWACWLSGHIALPLCQTHPLPMLEYFVQDSQSGLILVTPEYADKAQTLGAKFKIPIIVLQPCEYSESLPESKHHTDTLNIDSLKPTYQKHMDAMILYTSGTTGPPKGVVLSHQNILRQVNALVDAWNITHNDILLHCLPLHHLHGIVVALMTVLHSGATCILMSEFDAKQVWEELVSREPELRRVNLFMAVPTIYAKLIEEYNNSFGNSLTTKRYIRAVCTEKIRLMTCGSSALPEHLFSKWKEITGHTLLERYGMTETGISLTNPLNGKRKPGTVGFPLDDYEVRIAKANVYTSLGYDIIAQGTTRKIETLSQMKDESGELHVRGPGVFHQYWMKPKETKVAFTADGWFKTGDTVCNEEGYIKILGRTSVDIIKSGGYKISALDIERHLLSHPDVIECAVVGLPDLTWGQKVVAVLVTTPSFDQSKLREWCKERMPTYAIPTIFKVVKSISRNEMGKVNKKELSKELLIHA